MKLHTLLLHRDTRCVGRQSPTFVNVPVSKNSDPDVSCFSGRYCDTFNFWLLAHTSEPDPAGQLEWLLHVLADAEAASERVVILVSG